MKITGIDVFQVDLPVRGGPYRLSGGRVYTSYDATVVRLRTACGLEGWGESTPFGSTYVAAFAGGVREGLALVAPAVLGLDPRKTGLVYAAMDHALNGHPAVKTAIDVACWDLFGKATGLPVCDLLGGRMGGPVPVISSIGGDDPEAMRAKVAAHRAQGFRSHSIKIGATENEGGPTLDAERIAACLADRAPGEWFLADANNGLSVEHALRMLALVPDRLDFVLEAPVASRAEMKALRARSNLAMLLDELLVTDEDVIFAISENLMEGAGLKVSKQGGLSRMRAQREICVAAGKVMSVQDTVGSEIAFAAILHAAEATPRHLLRSALDPRAMVTRSTAKFDAPLISGAVQAPDLPGLGVTPDLGVLGAPVAVYEA